MRIRGISQAVVIVCIVGASACSKTPTAPKTVVPPAVVSSEFEYQVGSFWADTSGYTVKRLEYADSNGVVRKVDYQPPVWRQILSLKPGDRMYVRAEVDFPSGLAGGIQIVGLPYGVHEFYASDMAERVDGPATAVLVIDEIVK